MIDTLFNKKYLPWAILFLWITAIYSPSINGPYILDDNYTIRLNSVIHNLSNFSATFTTAKSYSAIPSTWTYRPLITFSNMFCWWVGNGATWPFHILKILIFFGLCFLLFQIWSKLLPSIDSKVIFLFLFIFALNPVHSQVINYISATSSLLAAFFVCLSIATYIVYQEKKIFWIFLLSLVSSFLAIMSKEEGVVAIALIVIIDLYLKKSYRFNKKILFYLVPLFCGLTLLYLKYEPITANTRGSLPSLHYFFTQIRAYIRYMAMFFISFDLNADNLQFGFSTSFFDQKVMWSTLINLIIISVSLFNVRQHPYVLLGILWFYIAISPASSFVVLAEPVNDHRAFIGYLGFAIPLIVLLNYAIKNYSKWAYLIIILLITGYSIQTFLRSQIWQSNQKIWVDTVKKNKDSVRALNNLAADYMGEGRNLEAQNLLQQCLEKSTAYAMCYINLGVVSANLGFDEQAEKYFSLSVNIDDTKLNSRYRWALFLSTRGYIERPIHLLEECDRLLEGINLDTRLELISLYVKRGTIDEARKLWVETQFKLGPQSDLIALGNKYGFSNN